MVAGARAALSAREAEILDALADRLTNAEIAARLFISVRTVESHVSSLLRKLDATDRRVLAEIGRDHRVEGVGQAGGGRNLLRFVGRQEEVAELTRLVAAERLITITGSGGTGKTRLAVEFGRREAQRFPEGVVAIELAPVRDPALVATTAAAALGVRSEPGIDLTEAITRYLKPRRALVLLDNCEHVADAAAGLAQALVGGDGRVVVIATSREALRLTAERVVRLAPLPVPEPGSSAESTDGAASVELFVDRAARADASFRITSDNRNLVREICAAADGLPLALELAAARLAELPLAALARSLASSLNVLERGGRDTPERHRTIRRTVDWSYQLLDDAQRLVFDRLSVFAGTFSLDAAETVAGFGVIDPAAVAAHLASLVAKSLVVREAIGYRLLEPVRQFAAERLELNEDAATVADRHVAHFVAATERLGLGYTTAGTPEVLDAFRADDANIRAALTHAFGPSARDPNAAVRLVGATTWRWFIDGMLDEAEEWTTRAVEVSEGFDGELRLVALYGRASIALSRADLEMTTRLTAEMSELAAALGREDFLAYAADLRGNADWGLGNLEAADAALTAAVERSQRAGLYWHGAFALSELARVVGDRGDRVRAHQLAERALEASRSLGEYMPIGFALDVRANQHFADGRVDDAEAVATQSLEHYRRIGYREGIASATHLLARIELARGDLDACRHRLDETLDLHRQLGHRGGIAAAMESMAMLLAAQGEYRESAVVLGAADELRRNIGVATSRRDRPAVDELRRQLHEQLTEAFMEAARRGAMLGLDAVRNAGDTAREPFRS